MRRLLFDPEGNIRVIALILLMVLVPSVVLALATVGGWGAVVGIGVLIALIVTAAVFYG